MHKNINFLHFLGNADAQQGLKDAPPTPWRVGYPMLADDFWFNYPMLVQKSVSTNTPLGTMGSTKKSVAVIGAGISGTEAMRELVRAGYTVHLYEGSNRIGGRTDSWRAPGTAGTTPTAQLTAYEQGAMRIPFFNKHNPVVAGPGPYVGGPYQTPGTTFPNMELTSMAECWANWYAISTAAFPDPGKAPTNTWDPVTKKITDTQAYPGVDTFVYVNEGRGVDLSTLYPTALGFKFYGVPDTKFNYAWPADSPDVSQWPTADINAGKMTANMLAFYNKGTNMNVETFPNIQLSHAIPYTGNPFVDGSANATAFDAGITALRTVSYKWTIFASAWLYTIAKQPWTLGPTGSENLNPSFNQDTTMYGGDNWETFWREKVMPRYQNVNFYEVAVAGPILPTYDAGTGVWTAPPEWAEGNFGGLGMSGAEAQLFYTVGAGDGSWGAFFPNSSLWALRALLFGFANQHQLILGCLDASQNTIDPNLQPPASSVPYIPPTEDQSARLTLTDSKGNKFFAPGYSGVNAFSECAIFKPCVGTESVWDMVQAESNVCIFTSSKVTNINRLVQEGTSGETATIEVTTADGKKIGYDHVICTVPIWNTQTDMTITGFYNVEPWLPPQIGSLLLPMEATMGLHNSHWIRSAKVFVTLSEPYWKVGPNDTRTGLLPQVLATNSELQDMYGLNMPTANDQYPTTGGIALISYTWEDDAQKFLSYQAEDLVRMLLARLDVVLTNAYSYLPPEQRPTFSKFMLDSSLQTPGSYSVFRWSLEPFYHGCAKAYQPGIENMNYSLMTYNNNYAKFSGLYFAGDSYGLESGWLEPALRLGMDAAINIMQNDGVLNNNNANLGNFNYDTDYKTAQPLTTLQAQVTNPLGPTTGTTTAAAAPPPKEEKKEEKKEQGEGGCCTVA